MLATLLVIAATLLVAPAARAASPWQTVGNVLNFSGATDIGRVSMGVAGATPTAAWREANTVKVRRWNGASWVSLGQVSGAGAAGGPSVKTDGTDPWVAYHEDVAGATNIFVEEYTAGSWNARGASLNISASAPAVDPKMAFLGTTPYVVWSEGSPKRIYCKRWNGASWVQVGGGALNSDTSQDADLTDIAFVGGQPWVVTHQWDGTAWQAIVRRWTGAAWATVGANLNNTPTNSTFRVSIDSDGTTPYVAFTERVAGNDIVFVKHWDGSTWVQDGGQVNEWYTPFVDITLDGTGVPYLAFPDWNGASYVQRVARWNGITWTQLGGLANLAFADNSYDGVVEFVSGEAWLGYQEQIAGVFDGIVRRYANNNTMVGNVTGVSAIGSAGRVDLSWTNPPDADYSGVRIYRSTTDGTLGTLVTTAASPLTSYADTGRTNGTRLYYTLVATNAAGDARETSYFVGDGQISPARYGGATASDGTRVWTFGGCTSCTVVNQIWEHVPATDSAALQPNPTPSARTKSAAAYASSVGKVFVMGGTDGASGLTNVFTYNTTTDAVASVGNLPAARVDGGGVYAPNTDRVYFLGGENQAGTTAYTDIYAVNPGTNAVTDTGLDLPQAMSRFHPVYWPDDGCIYAFGGRDAAGADSAQVVRFCPQAGTVANVATLPAVAESVAAYSTTDDIVLAGGYGGTYQSKVLSYTPSTKQFLTHSMTLPRAVVGYGAPVGIGAAELGILATQYPTSQKPIQVNAAALATARPSVAPNTPTNTAPAAAAVIGTTTPTLTSSAFADGDGGDTHFASQWQVRTNAGTYAAATLDTGVDTTHLTSMPLTSALGQGQYWFRVRYSDQGQAWSAWSAETTFTVDTVTPTAPTPGGPASGTNTTITPTLNATYNDTAPGTPGTLTFQLCSNATCSAVITTGTATGLAPGSSGSWATPALTSGTTYYWRVSGTDGAGTVGAWSAISSFTAITVTVVAPTPVTTAPRGLQNLTLQVNGTNFVSGATVSFSGTGISVQSTTFVNATRITVVIDIASTATVSARNITVTNPDTLTGTGTGVFSVTANSLSVGLDVVGYSDALRTTVGPFGVDFGSWLPGTTRAIGTAGSGQTRTGEAAVVLPVSSDVDYDLKVVATAFAGPAALPLGNLQWKHHSVAEAWTGMSTTTATMEAAKTPGATSYSYDLQLALPAAQKSGSYSTTVTYTILPAF